MEHTQALSILFTKQMDNSGMCISKDFQQIWQASLGKYVNVSRRVGENMSWNLKAIGGSGVIFAFGIQIKVPITGVSMLFTE